MNTHYLLICLHLSRYDLSLSHLTLLPSQAKSILTYLSYPQTDDALYFSASLLLLFILLQVLILR